MISNLFSFQNSRFIFDLFLENKISAFYNCNVLNNLTNTTIKAKSKLHNNFKNIYIVKDIPNYLILNLAISPPLAFKKVNQYAGFLINLVCYNSVDDYVNNQLNTRNRKNLNSKKNKLYKNHNISSHFFFGSINKNDYNSIFKTFYILLKNRFDKKKTYNRYLADWKDLEESTFTKILKKQASLHVIYDNLKPIAITLNFHKEDIVFSHIQAFDTNYSKYNMGDISMVNHLEWLINNNIPIFDLSMGKTYYKEKWCNHNYTFVYYIFYNKNSILSKIYAEIIVKKLIVIQQLRDKNIIGKWINFDKILYQFKTKFDT